MSTRNERNESIALLQHEFKGATGIFMTDFSNINVEKITQLRSNLRKSGIRYLVVKNTIAEKAFEQCKLEQLIPFLKGPTGIAVTKGDSIQPAKVLKDFKKENKNLLPIKASYVDGSIFNPEETLKLADMPSKEILLSQLLSCMSAPIANFVGVLNGIMTKFVGTIEAIKMQKENEQGK